MATSRRGFIQLVGLNGLAVAAAGCATARPARTPAVAPQAAPPLGALGTRSSLIRLSSNENSAGPGAKVLTAMQDSFGVANRYAFRLPSDLADAVAGSLGVQPSQVALGCGSSEILDSAAAAFLGPGRALVTAMPTFELLSGRAAMWGSDVIDVPVDAELRLDLDQMAGRARGAGLIFVCNPNNPTGTVHGAADIEAFVAAALRAEPKATILIDEAYHEYVEHADYKTSIGLALSNPRVVVSRTFSKVYGMAGLRVGYAVGQSETLRAMHRFLDSGRLSCLSARAGLTALADQARVAEMCSNNHAARAMTVQALRDAGYRVADSEANFVMADVQRDIRVFQRACRDRGVEIARPFPPLLTWARITIGAMAEMQQAVEAFRGALAEPLPTADALPALERYVPRRDGTWAC
ncbi:MAG: aminotransferase class I/II-fold pyridoxal phosphate-dependent enzyme [Vicinamibacteria bacterium]|nr:aminotransferase class I/II-fold pyridoxal phosphate-dependent enzyme [Vicinamibacteria bacterium]